MLFIRSAKKTLFFVFILICSFNVEALVQGNSAWLYGKDDQWIKKISEFNGGVSKEKRLNYLFPEVGSVHIDDKNKKIIMTYDSSVTEFYKMKLPDIRIIPDLSFWVANTNFKTWTAKQYQAAANEIVNDINQDPNADGVFLDLESYVPNLLSFYVALVHGLKSHHKILSVIVRPGQENITWFKTLGGNAFVVLYGYDLHHPEDSLLPVSPVVYQQRLNVAVDHLMQVAKVTKTPVMGGAPAIATTYEWEQKILNKNKPGQSLQGQYRQLDYLKAALGVYKQIHSPLYMGFSIWAFILDTKAANQTYLPYQLCEEAWHLFKMG